MIVVSDAIPLISLMKALKLEILEELFNEALISLFGLSFGFQATPDISSKKCRLEQMSGLEVGIRKNGSAYFPDSVTVSKI